MPPCCFPLDCVGQELKELETQEQLHAGSHDFGCTLHALARTAIVVTKHSQTFLPISGIKVEDDHTREKMQFKLGVLLSDTLFENKYLAYVT